MYNFQATRAVPVESPVIGTVTSPIKGTITAATGPDGTQTVDLAALKMELTQLRDKIDHLLSFFPVQLKMESSAGEFDGTFKRDLLVVD